MTKTSFSRKLETNGRILIPSKLREQMSMQAGQCYDFFIHEAKDGHKYICIDCGTAAISELEKAIQLVQASGMKIV